MRRTARTRTIRTRLLVGFGSTISLLFLTGAVGTALLRRAYDGLELRAREIVSVKGALFASEAATRQYVLMAQNDLLRGRDASTAQLDSVTVVADSLRTALTVGETITDEERARLGRIAVLQERIGTRLALARAHQDLGEADGMLQQIGYGSALLDSLFSESQAIIAEEDARAADTLARQHADVARQQALVIALLALGLAAAIAAGVVTWRAVTRPLDRLTTAARRVGEGHLDATVDGEGLDEEYRVLAKALADTTRHLSLLVRQIQHEAASTADAATALTAASGEAAASTNEVSAAMTQIVSVAELQREAVAAARSVLGRVTSAATELDGTAREAREVESEVRRLTNDAQTGIASALTTLERAQSVIGRSASNVQRVEESSRLVEQFLDLMQRISQQTDLLALNAAIEAARAGDRGRGFAVVADEIRKLAEDSSRAADEVGRVVATMRSEVASAAAAFRDGVGSLGNVDATSRTVTEALSAIGGAIGKIDAMTTAVTTVAEASRRSVGELQLQMASTADHAESQVAASAEASAGAEETAAASEEVAATAHELAASAGRLKALVAEFVT